MSQNQTADILERLVSSKVFVQSPDNTIRFSDEFATTRARIRTAFEIKGSDVIDSAVVTPSLPKRVLVDANSLLEFDSTLSPEAAINVAWSLAVFKQSIPTIGVPEGFVPVEFEEIEPFVSRFPATVLYLWRDDCPPCVLIREDLQSLVEEKIFPDWMGRAAIYGPDCAAELSEKYDVGGAPTLLFWEDGFLASRFTGAKARTSIKQEIKTITEQVEKSCDS